MRSLAFFFITVFCCVTGLATAHAQLVTQERRVWAFPSGVSISNEFSGARLANVEPGVGPHSFRLQIDREGPDVAYSSGWYGFELSAKETITVELTLFYPWGDHRSAPRVSRDEGRTWSRHPGATVRSEDGREATFSLEIGPEPVRVAAGELIDLPQMEAWSDAFAQRPEIEKFVFGRSVAGRPLHALRSTAKHDPDTARTLIVLTYQHPPEHTGGFAFHVFMERLWGDTALARAFRERHHILAVPVANPDGVHEGHWRNNLGDRDLNRDWVEFSQPETRALRELFMGVPRPLVFIDLHATHKDVFYTFPDDQTGPPHLFLKDWIEALQGLYPGREVPREVAHNVSRPTARQWATTVLGVSAVTWEFGYNSEREWIAAFANSGADELMRRFVP